MGDPKRSPDRRADPSPSPFPPEPSSDLRTALERIEALRAAGEALDAVLQDARRFASRAARSARPAPVVLVVDDDADARTILATGLGALGFCVEEAADGAEGIARAQVLLPSVIVLDYSMPKMDGAAAQRQLAADPRTRSIPVLMLSAFADRVPREARLACAAFLAKPCTAEELGGLLHLMIAAAHGTRAAEPAPR